MDIIKAARQCGFSEEIIVSYTKNGERLKQILLSTQPSIAARFLQVQPVVAKPAKPPKMHFIDYRDEFDVDVMAGTGPLEYLFCQAERFTARAIQRRGLARIQRIQIDRNMVANKHNRLVSHVVVDYQKEEVIKEDDNA